jgi:hypothetical protein
MLVVFFTRGCLAYKSERAARSSLPPAPARKEAPDEP